MGTSDFRSDTVTRPDRAMREAMACAVVGDDVLGDDPTVKELESKVARLCGMEAGLFVPSGTMGNQVALHVQCRPGDEVLADPATHVFNYEGAGAARFSGVQVRQVAFPAGGVDPAALDRALRDPLDEHQPISRLVVEENTQNLRGGSVIPPEAHDELLRFCRGKGLLLHVDGARIWNAAVASGVPPARLLQGADTAMVCLSKGLGAPVGSVLLGSGEFREGALRARKAFGGGMRQSGVLAAAALQALEGWEERIAADHRRARLLAAGLEGIAGLRVENPRPASNMVYLEVVEGGADAAKAWEGRLAARGVLCIALGKRIRLVTHRDVGDDDVERALRAFRDAQEETK